MRGLLLFCRQSALLFLISILLVLVLFVTLLILILIVAVLLVLVLIIAVLVVPVLIILVLIGTVLFVLAWVLAHDVSPSPQAGCRGTAPWSRLLHMEEVHTCEESAHQIHRTDGGGFPFGSWRNQRGLAGRIAVRCNGRDKGRNHCIVCRIGQEQQGIVI